ncbi:hypothetical protein IEQ34_014456 [Dendrobium chrysotoxum]|uniref:Cytochrome b5 heme-binding domain-containing protein n=1 Tax=Dendrobium chrysotoxum TaxID=161865 RepID=A0AAV7GLJ1_DENCH|nr:hypothetical protein IEQ34_014456 [Dendrobium chrysotoxum]
MEVIVAPKPHAQLTFEALAISKTAEEERRKRSSFFLGDQKLYHFDDVSKHSATKDCWLIIHGKVYDVTPFMDDHPGGDEVLLAATKKDATNDFEDVGHSNPARDLMDKYCIGKIDASTLPVNRVFIQPEQTPYNPDKTSGFTSKILPFLVPVMILGLAFAARYYTRAE